MLIALDDGQIEDAISRRKKRNISVYTDSDERFVTAVYGWSKVGHKIILVKMMEETECCIYFSLLYVIMKHLESFIENKMLHLWISWSYLAHTCVLTK